MVEESGERKKERNWEGMREEKKKKRKTEKRRVDVEREEIYEGSPQN